MLNEAKKTLSASPRDTAGEPDVGAVLTGVARWALVRGEALSFLRSLPETCVDAVITDPPYSSGGLTRSDRLAPPSRKYVQTGTKTQRPEFAGDARDQHAFAYWCALWLSECLRVAKPGSPLCVFTDWRQRSTRSRQVAGSGEESSCGTRRTPRVRRSAASPPNASTWFGDRPAPCPIAAKLASYAE